MTELGTSTAQAVGSMYICRICGDALLIQDLYEQGLRPPEPDETWDDYMEAELLDGLEHLACLRGQPPVRTF